jgi:hypothetical protein
LFPSDMRHPRKSWEQSTLVAWRGRFLEGWFSTFFRQRADSRGHPESSPNASDRVRLLKFNAP